MSWLARSIANTLLIDDDPQPTSLSSSNADDNHSQLVKGRLDARDHTHEEIQGSEIEDQYRTGGLKDDLSEFTESLTRQLWGVASFLAPPPPSQLPPPSHRHSTTTFQPDPSVPDRDGGDPYVSGEDNDHVSISAYDDSRFGVGCGTSGSLSFPTSDQIENIEAVGVTEEALAFARNISHHPETWLDFPLSEEEEDDDDFEMSDTQWNHVTLVERLAPRLAALRIELCPIHMSESYFWKVYFVLLHPRLNKHDADLLSTPQIVAARTMWIKDLQKRTKTESELSKISTPHALDGSNSLHEDFSTASDFPSANMSQRTAHPFEATTHYSVTEKYPFTRSDNLISDKSVTEEEGLTKTPLDHRTACSYTIPMEDEDDDDDWIHENSELNGYVGPDVHIGTDEDISFSDLEADDDCTMPIRSKIM